MLEEPFSPTVLHQPTETMQSDHLYISDYILEQLHFITGWLSATDQMPVNNK